MAEGHGEPQLDAAKLWARVRTAEPVEAIEGMVRLIDASWYPRDEMRRFNELYDLAMAYRRPPADIDIAIGQRVTDVRAMIVGDGFAVARDGEGRALVCGWPEGDVRHEVASPGYRCWHLHVGPNGPLLASSDLEGAITCYHLPSGTPAQQLKGHRSRVTAMVVLDDETWISGSEGGEVLVWDLTSSAPRLRLQAGGSPVAALFTDPLGEWVLAWHRDGAASAWRLEDGCPIDVAPTMRDMLELEMTPDGRLLVGTQPDFEGASLISLLRAPDGELLSTVSIEDALAVRMLISPTGRTCVFSATHVEDRVYVVSLPDGVERCVLFSAGIAHAYSPDGRFWVDADYPEATVWDGHTYERLGAVERSSSWSPVFVSFSPDSRYLVIGEACQPLQVWEMAKILATAP